MSPISVWVERLTTISKSMAKTKGAVIWSKDAGFVRRARQSTTLQVVWLRLGNTTNAELQTKLASRLQAIAAKLAGGEKLIEVR